MTPRLALLLSFGLTLTAAMAETPANLIQNAALTALADNGLPDGWWPFNAPGATFKASVVDAGHDGAKAVSVKGTGDYGGVITNHVLMAADQAYVGGGWVKYQGAGTAQLKLDYLKGDQWLGNTEAGTIKAGPDWQAFSLSDARGKFPTADTLALTMVTTGEGQAWFSQPFLVSAPRPEGAASNLLENGDLENGIGTMAGNVFLAFPEGEKPTATWTADAAHSGLHGLRMKNDQGYFVAALPPIPLDRTKTYTLTGWVRARGGEATLKFDFLEGNTWLDQQPAETQAGNEWTKITVVLDPAKCPKADRITAAMLVSGAGGDADFDDLVIQAK